MTLAYPVPDVYPVRIPPEPTPACRICGVDVPSEDFGEFDELGARCTQCVQEEAE